MIETGPYHSYMRNIPARIILFLPQDDLVWLTVHDPFTMEPIQAAVRCLPEPEGPGECS